MLGALEESSDSEDPNASVEKPSKKSLAIKNISTAHLAERFQPKQVLNIIKEVRRKDASRKVSTSNDGTDNLANEIVHAHGIEDSDEEMEDYLAPEDYLKKRNRKETKEERKKRKALVKEFKRLRKQKK